MKKVSASRPDQLDIMHNKHIAAPSRADWPCGSTSNGSHGSTDGMIGSFSSALAFAAWNCLRISSSPNGLFTPRFLCLVSNGLRGLYCRLRLARNDGKFREAAVWKLGVATELKPSKECELPQRYLRNM